VDRPPEHGEDPLPGAEEGTDLCYRQRELDRPPEHGEDLLPSAEESYDLCYG